MKKGTCQIKIVDDFPIARIYIDGVEVRGVRKFEVKRSVGKIAIVITMINNYFHTFIQMFIFYWFHKSHSLILVYQ